MNKQTYSLLFVIAACLLLSLLYIPAYNPSQCDKEIFRYIGMGILKGNVPYRDVFDHKPPLIFFLNAASLLIGEWGLWLIDTSLALLASLLFFDLGNKYRLPYPWLLPLLFNLMIRDHLLCIGMGMTREYTAMFLLIFFCVLMGKNRYRHYLLGILSGLIFFMQQDQVIALIPLFAYAFLRQDDPAPLFRRVILSAAGFATIALPVILYFAWYRALGDFWKDAFVFNTAWYTTTLRESFGDHLRRVKRVLDARNYEVPFLVTVTLGISSLFLRNSNKKLVVVCLSTVGLSIIPEFMGGRATANDFTHYFLPLSASLNILLFSVFAFTEEPVIRESKAQAVYGFLVCCSLAYIALQHATHLRRWDSDDASVSPEMKYLRLHRPGDCQLYEFCDNQFVVAYNEFRILAPSPWIYHHFWMLYKHWDDDQSLLHSIGRDLLFHRTTYIADFSKPSFFHDPAAYAWWKSFLAANYQPIVLTGRSEITLWKLKDP